MIGRKGGKRGETPPRRRAAVERVYARMLRSRDAYVGRARRRRRPTRTSTSGSLDAVAAQHKRPILASLDEVPADATRTIVSASLVGRDTLLILDQSVSLFPEMC
jgi:hypothetical protein